MAQRRAKQPANAQDPAQATPPAEAAPVTKKPKGNANFAIVVVTIGAVVLALGSLYLYGTFFSAQAGAERRLGNLPAPTDVLAWTANGASTSIQVAGNAELDAYETSLIEQGAQVVSRGMNTTVLQQGLTDIILLRDMSGSGQVIVLPGEEIPWPIDEITQALPRPINCTLVQVDQPDDVTAAYTFRACKENTARKYVEDLIVNQGWSVLADVGYSGATGPFSVLLTRDAYTLSVDYYMGASGYVVLLTAS